MVLGLPVSGHVPVKIPPFYYMVQRLATWPKWRGWHARLAEITYIKAKGATVGAVTSVAVYKTWHAVPQGSYSIHSGQNSWLQFTLFGCPHYPMRCTYMYALYSCVGKAKGNTLRAQSILVQGHAYTGNPWPHPPDTVTQQHHPVRIQLVLSESFMSAYS